MTRIYENRGYRTRQNISLAIIAAVVAYGLFEIWYATTDPEPAGLALLLGMGQDNYIFGGLFIAGGAYAYYTLLKEASDLVATLDLDETTGETVTTLWRPLKPITLTAPRGAITNWRLYVKIGNRNLRTPVIYADHPGHPRPIEFDLRRADLTALRQLAPEAVSEFEAMGAPRV